VQLRPAGPAQKRGVRVTIEPAELTVAPGSEVTTTVTVRNLGTRVEEFRLMPRGRAAWKSGSGKLTFPGGDGDITGFVLIRDPGTLEDGTTARVLETHPQEVANGFITGMYPLAEPVVPGDHVRARVGLPQGAGGEVTFVVKANGKIIQQVPDGTEGTLKVVDVGLGCQARTAAT
jgi:hypothetical protein